MKLIFLLIFFVSFFLNVFGINIKKDNLATTYSAEYKKYTETSRADKKESDIILQSSQSKEIKKILQEITEKINQLESLIKGDNTVKNKDKKLEIHRIRRWGRWTPWSACSVTCGKGREIRWRYCISKTGCQGVETEMEEKTCQLPACGPNNFFGLF